MINVSMNMNWRLKTEPKEGINNWNKSIRKSIMKEQLISSKTSPHVLDTKINQRQSKWTRTIQVGLSYSIINSMEIRRMIYCSSYCSIFNNNIKSSSLHKKNKKIKYLERRTIKDKAFFRRNKARFNRRKIRSNNERNWRSIELTEDQLELEVNSFKDIHKS